MRKELVRDLVWSFSVATLVLTFVFGFSPAIAWLGTTFLGY